MPLKMFPMKNENSQILRTKRLLYDALFSLMQEHPFSELTVKDICHRADVSRAVFYNHYSNKESLLFEMFRRCATVYWIKATNSISGKTQKRCRTLYTVLCYELMRFRPFYQLLYQNNYDWLLADLLKLIHNHFFELVSGKTAPIESDYQQYFIPYHATALSALFFHWLNEPNPISPEEMADIAIRLLRSSNVDAFLMMPK